MEKFIAAFKTVFDFRSERAWPAALGFYFFYLIVGVFVAAIASFIVWVVTGLHGPEDVRRISMMVGHVVGPVYTTAIYVTILRKKKRWKEPWLVVGLIVTPLLGGIVSALLGLIPSAIAITIESDHRLARRLG